MIPCSRNMARGSLKQSYNYNYKFFHVTVMFNCKAAGFKNNIW